MKGRPNTNLQRMYARPRGLVSALAGVEGVIHSSTSQGRGEHRVRSAKGAFTQHSGYCNRNTDASD